MVERKIAVVAYAMGRIGSSALMGLLELAGLNTGEKDRIAGPSPINPKGIFELKSQQHFLEKVYKGIYPGVSQPPAWEFLDKIGESNYGAFNDLIVSEFKGRYPAAIKAQRFLTIPFFYRLRDKYDIKIIVLDRNINDQASSILRVWKKYGDDFQQSRSLQFITDWLLQWKRFSATIKQRYEFDYLHILFEDLLENPNQCFSKVARFLNIKENKIESSLNWIDRSLVNRKEL